MTDRKSGSQPQSPCPAGGVNNPGPDWQDTGDTTEEK